MLPCDCVLVGGDFIYFEVYTILGKNNDVVNNYTLEIFSLNLPKSV